LSYKKGRDAAFFYGWFLFKQWLDHDSDLLRKFTCIPAAQIALLPNKKAIRKDGFFDYG
jgi:hypothetical protein